MYYEEKVIDGILHSRGEPDGEWKPFGLVGLTVRDQNQAARIASLEAALNSTLQALIVFSDAVVAKDMIVPMWVNDCIDDLTLLKGKQP